MDVAVVVVIVVGFVVRLWSVVFVATFDFNSIKCSIRILTPFKAPFMCSLCSSYGLAQTDLPLCVRVLNTLYLADRLWWLYQ